MTADDLKVFGGIGAVLAVVAAFIHAAVQQDRHERDLIASGTCKVDHSEWYTPPPSMVCTSHTKEGACTFWVPIENEPYRREHWACPGEGFWRKAAE